MAGRKRDGFVTGEGPQLIRFQLKTKTNKDLLEIGTRRIVVEQSWGGWSGSNCAFLA